MKGKASKYIFFIFFSIVAIFASPLYFHNDAEAIEYINVKSKFVNKVKLKNANASNGATLSNGYFIFTNDDGNGNEAKRKTFFYRCSWTQVLSGKEPKCTVINPGGSRVEHGNALDAKDNSRYFWALDLYYGENKNYWCFDSMSGKKVKNANCGDLPSYKDNRKSGKKNGKYYNNLGGKIDATLTQDLAVYGQYILKAWGNKAGSGKTRNMIEVIKNGKTIEILNIDKKRELEGLFVDGNTGKIYYTNVHHSEKKLYIYQIIKYSLPPLASSSSQDSPSSSSGNSSGSSSSNKPEQVPSSYDGTIDTALFGTIKEDGEGCGIFHILVLIFEIMTYGVGILGVLGIVITGTQYLTAGGREEQVVKAKRRFFEIVIGIAVYAVLWAAVNWLLPGGKLNNSSVCPTASSQTTPTDKIT